MGQKVEVGGTGYDLKGGKPLIGGTAYAIKKGRTLIDGTGYDVAVVKMHKVTITGKFSYFNYNNVNGLTAEITINGQIYSSPTEIYVVDGTQISCLVHGIYSYDDNYRMWIRYNGRYVVNNNPDDEYSGKYSFEVTSDCVIVSNVYQINTSMPTSGGQLDITTS